MENTEQDDTQLSKTHLEDTRPVKTESTAGLRSLFFGLQVWVIGLLIILVLVFILTVGSVAGYQSGRQFAEQGAQHQSRQEIQQQYDLGIQNYQAGEYELALQRFEYVLSQDPNFPGITERIAEAMAIVYATATPVQKATQILATPTTDLRPVEELFSQAQNLINTGDWSSGIDTLLSLRKADPNYQTARVDGLLYLAHRSRGVDKILNQRDLEGGMYDLAIAAKFGPLDNQASSAQEWARLYIVGLSFWEVHPEQAVYYFSQVASAAPYLSDASGYTATERYRLALMQFAGLLGNGGNWCAAQQQYELALAVRPDEQVQALVEQAALKCSPPTPTNTEILTTATPLNPTTAAPPPTTAAPTTQAPPTQEPTKEPPTGLPPTNTIPPTPEPTQPPPTQAPATTAAPPTTEVVPTTQAPTTEVPATDTTSETPQNDNSPAASEPAQPDPAAINPPSNSAQLPDQSNEQVQGTGG